MVEELEKKETYFQLAKTGIELCADVYGIFHLPVKDVDDRVRLAKVQGHICDCASRNLLACAQSNLQLGENTREWLQLRDSEGKYFKAAITHRDHLPVIEVVMNGAATAALSVGAAKEKACALMVERKNRLSNSVLHMLHLRYGHATGHRLYCTFKEKKMAHRTTLEACRKVSEMCQACSLVNVRVKRIPKKFDEDAKVSIFNQVLYQHISRPDNHPLILF
eukprot:GHVR01036116.1.p1 GENE.GHVR01036116.1~~GHVR01036116.1.p1  ORF type:complete len:256 (+),score=32.63 GHVR01036116.1:108-770(+)